MLRTKTRRYHQNRLRLVSFHWRAMLSERRRSVSYSRPSMRSLSGSSTARDARHGPLHFESSRLLACNLRCLCTTTHRKFYPSDVRLMTLISSELTGMIRKTPGASHSAMEGESMMNPRLPEMTNGA